MSNSPSKKAAANGRLYRTYRCLQTPSLKRLQAQCLQERYRETETLIASLHQALAQEGVANIIQGLEIRLRDAVFGDARRIIENLLNDRSLVPDNESARSLEIIYHARPRQVDTLFGVVELRRNYYHHIKARTGRYPLDEALDLVRGHTPGLARMISRASTHSGSSEGRAGGRAGSDLFPVCDRTGRTTRPEFRAEPEELPDDDQITDAAGLDPCRGEGSAAPSFGSFDSFDKWHA